MRFISLSPQSNRIFHLWLSVFMITQFPIPWKAPKPPHECLPLQLPLLSERARITRNSESCCQISCLPTCSRCRPLGASRRRWREERKRAKTVSGGSWDRSCGSTQSECLIAPRPSSHGQGSPQKGPRILRGDFGVDGCSGWNWIKVSQPWSLPGHHLLGPHLQKTRSHLTGRAWAATLHCHFFQGIPFWRCSTLCRCPCRHVEQHNISGRSWPQDHDTGLKPSWKLVFLYLQLLRSALNSPGIHHPSYQMSWSLATLSNTSGVSWLSFIFPSQCF